MQVEFDGEIWFCKGPAPWYFVTVPEKECDDLKDVLRRVTYGWGMIPATVQIGATAWKTSLWPKDGGYIVPVKTVVREAEHLEEGDTVTLHLRVDL